MKFDEIQEKQHFIDLWNARESTGMSHKKADWDKRAQGWEKSLREDEEAKKRTEDRVNATVKYLLEKGVLNENADVIDIGCGPGRFVGEFAKYANHVTGTDLSSGMCGFGEEFAKVQGINNTSFTPCDFKAADIEEMGWKNRFDLVFSSITPAMSTYDSLLKSEEMSRGYCFQSNYIKMSDPLGEEILAKVLPCGLKMMHRGIRATYTLTNILWMQGCYPEITYYTEISHTENKVDEKMVHNIIKYVPGADQAEGLADKIYEMLLKEAASDGTLVRETKWVYSWVLWDTRNVNSKVIL